MSIVNVKVANIHPKYNDLSEWCNCTGNEYIGRAGIVFCKIDGKNERYPKISSIWYNPFKVGKHGTRDEVIEKYESYIRQMLNNSSDLQNKLLELKNKNLGCWCFPEKCHGNVLLKLIEEAEKAKIKSEKAEEAKIEEAKSEEAKIEKNKIEKKVYNRNSMFEAFLEDTNQTEEEYNKTKEKTNNK